MKEKIIVGMSGGVDSAVASAILKEEGFEVEGLFMKNWEEDSEFCHSEQDYKDALQVCDILDIPLRAVNFSKQYWDRVFKYFLNEYEKGRTPNPDILCNTEIKFKEFYNYSIDLGAQRIATGHYVQTKTCKNNILLLKGSDPNKDQSYFLHKLDQRQISNALFPIGQLKKKDVRTFANKYHFANFSKKDSVGICFIGKRDLIEFLPNYIPKKTGYIIDEKGKKIGTHQGVMFYTIGQRKGLGIGGLNSGKDGGWYVADKDIINNELIAVQGQNHPALYHTKLIASNIHWISGSEPTQIQLKAKIRYRGKEKACNIKKLDNNMILVSFEEPRFAICPGQSVVFYQNNICLGGALIECPQN
tara:strand:+ start:1238 stop:2314 length:1077 start_codon:yes stop_codon:yes gene_type:complete